MGTRGRSSSRRERLFVALAERTPRARLVTLPALGHFLHPVYLDRIADEILQHTR